MIKTLTSVLLALTTFTASAQIIVESRVPGGGVSSNPPYSELAGTWLSSTLKSTAPGITAGVGSRFSSNSNGFPAFAVKPTLVPDKTYSVEVTHGSASSIPTNLLASISVLGGSGLPPITDVFARANANTWEYVGDLTLDPGISDPEITFTYATNQPAPNSSTRRFYADAVRFTEATMDPPQIVSQPSSRTNLAGTTATFSVSATGAIPMLFAWRKDGVALVSSGAISGTATPSLTISNVSSGSIGFYDVVITNSYGSVVSDAATLTVTNASAIPPSITNQPQSQTVAVGQTVSFSVGAAGTSPLSYQWAKDGVTLTNDGRISGVNTAFLVVSNAALTDAADYLVTVSNTAGTTNSNPATLTVNPAIPPSITNQPQSQTVVVGQTVSFSVGAAGTSLLSYQWAKDGVTLSNGARISGVSTAFLIVSNATLGDAANYSVTVSNTAGTTNSNPALLTVNAAPPSITAQPQSQTVATGQSVVFNVTVTGTSPFGYQWAFNGINLPGATGSALTVTNAQASNQGTYVVTVTNSVGSVTSLPATLTVVAPSSIVVVESMISSNVVNSFPPYQEISSIWQTASLKSSAAGVTAGVGSRFATNGAPVFAIKPTLQAGGIYSIAVTHGSTTSIPSNLVVNITVTGGTGLPSTTTAFASSGANTWVAVGTLTLDAGVTQPDITFSYSTNQTSASSTRRLYADAIRFVLSSNSQPTIVSQPTSQTNLVGAAVNFNVALTGTAPLLYQWRKDGNALFDTGTISGANSAALAISSISLGDAGSYDVVVTNSYGSVVSATATLTVTNPPVIPPGITNQPQGQTIVVGQTALFSVGATGTSPLSYQWVKDGITLTNGGRISGVSNALLVVSNAALGDAGNYTVTVSNSAGSTNSDIAVLTVVAPPSITTQPQSQSVTAGQTALFSVAVTGTSPFGYQWTFNGTNLSGATGSTLTIANAQTNNQGNYVVTVTNSAGSATSAAATLTVTSPAATVIVESMIASNVVNSFPPYQEITSPWLTTSLKSFATGVTAGVGSRFATNGNPVFAVKPTLLAGGTYTIAVTHGSTTLIPSNLVVNITVAGGTGLPSTTTAFSSVGANTWVGVGTLTLDAGVTQPTITFAYATNQLLASSSRRLYADAIRFVPSTNVPLNDPPSIATQPTSQTNVVGATVTFNVAATGTAPLMFSWRKDGAPLANIGNITGTSTAALTLSSISSGDAGSYDVVVTNSYGTVVSAAATLSVTNAPAAIPPTITNQPQSQTIVAGQTAIFSVGATGTSPLVYQWLKNGITLTNGGRISGVTNASLVVSNAAFSDAANYTVTVSNAAGSTNSSVAVLTVNAAPPSITTQPQSQTAAAGQNALFSVTVAGTSPFGYQWMFNGSDLSGATGSMLTIANVQTNNQGSYVVTVTNSVGSVTSTAATLTVTAPAIPPSITNQPQNQTIVAGQMAIFSVGATGTGPLSYQWLKNGITLTNNGRITGVKNAFLVVSNAVLSDAGNYTVTVTNIAGTTNSDIAVLTVNAAPPTITSQPQSRTVTYGQSALFSVTVTGTSPFGYQWTFNGSDIAGATRSALTVTNAQTADQGSYVVTITNSAGSATSSIAALTVTAPGPTVIVESMISSNVVNSAPLYQEIVSTWQSVLTKSSAPGVTAGAGSRFATNGAPAFRIKPTLQAGGIYSIAVTHASVSTIPSNLVVNITVAGGTGLPDTTTAFSSLGANTWVGLGTLTLDAGVTQPDITFSWSTNSQAVANSTRRIYADAIRFVLSSNSLPAIVSQPVSQTNVVGAAVNFNVAATGVAPLLYQWRKDGVPLANTGDISGADTATLSISSVLSTDGGSYDVVITNSFGLVISSPALLAVTNPVPPAITAQPQSEMIAVGGTAFFSVTAEGTAPLTYQWRKDGTPVIDGGNVSGGTTSFLQITNASSGDAGSYDVIVSNAAGDVTSETADLVVTLPLVITTQPSNQVVLAGQDASFFVAFSGTPPFGYQWSMDGVDIPGATNDTLTVSNVQAENQGNYRVRISTWSSTVSSSFATLNISAPGAVVIESKLSDGSITPAPEYQEFGSWFASVTKSLAPGLTGVGSRFLLTGADPTFSVTPTLPTPGGMYAVEITHGWSPNIPNTNLLAEISVSGGGGLPEVTGAFGAWGSNVWKRVGTIVLDPTVTQPEIRFTYSTNQPPSSFSRRFYADGIRFIEIPTAPVITLSPTDQEVVLGGDASFVVEAIGTAPLSFQWSKDGTVLAGATNATLSLIGVQASDAGTYAVTVNNPGGMVVSSQVLLTVHFPAAITVPPVNREVIQGQSATFSVTATGDLPLNYQWQFNGLDIAGATENSLTLNGVTAADAGNYSVIVTNSYGFASATASLTVDVPPTILIQPVDVTVSAGESFTFSVTATGTSLHYQWQFNGDAIPGATESTLSGVSDDFNAGYYKVVISNVAGSVTSEAAKLIKPIPAGSYNGLFYEAAQVRHESSGLLHMDLVSSGSFTGKVSVAGIDYRFGGTFSDVHQANVSIPRPSNTPLTLALRLLTTNQNDVAAGTVSDGSWSANLLADRAFYATNNPPPQAGEYTMAFIGNSSGVTSPGGNGIGLVTVKTDGTISLHGGLLSDNVSINQSVPLSRQGQWPLYVSVYGGQGSVLGWITFANTATNSFQGDISWIKRGATNSYPAGFTNEMVAVGSTYIYPPASPGVLDLTNVTMTLSGSSLNAGLDFIGTIPVLPNNKLESSTGANQLKLKVKDNGRITGNLLWGPTGQLLPVNGVVLQQDKTARGFFIAPDKTTGSFLLRAP